MKNVLAIDASTKSSGLATIVDGKLICELITSSSTSVEKRIGIMRDGILNFIKKYNIDTVILEEVRPDGANAHTGKVLTWLQGCIAVAIWEYNKDIKVEFIGPSSWRSILGLQGYRIKREQQKQMDIDFVNKTYGMELKSTQDDEADAACILTAYLKDAATLGIKKKDVAFTDEPGAF